MITLNHSFEGNKMIKRFVIAAINKVAAVNVRRPIDLSANIFNTIDGISTKPANAKLM